MGKRDHLQAPRLFKGKRDHIQVAHLFKGKRDHLQAPHLFKGKRDHLQVPHLFKGKIPSTGTPAIQGQDTIYKYPTYSRERETIYKYPTYSRKRETTYRYPHPSSPLRTSLKDERPSPRGPPSPAPYLLDGLVAPRATDLGSNLAFPVGLLSRSSHTSDFKISTQRANLPGARRYKSALSLVRPVSVCCDWVR